MTIALRARGTFQGGGSLDPTACNPPYPAGLQSTDITLLMVVVKPYTVTINTPSGFTKVGDWTSGTVASGVNSGSVHTYVFSRVGAYTGSVGTLTGTGLASTGVDMVAGTFGFSIGAGKSWSVATDYGTCTSVGPSYVYTATAQAVMGLAAGDYLMAISGLSNCVAPSNAWIDTKGTVSNTDANRVWLTPANGDLVSPDTGFAWYWNNIGSIILAYNPFVSGTDASPVAYQQWDGSAQEGVTVFLRLREVTLPTNVSDGDTCGAVDAGSFTYALATQNDAMSAMVDTHTVLSLAYTDNDTMGACSEAVVGSIYVAPRVTDADTATQAEGQPTVPWLRTWVAGERPTATEVMHEWNDTYDYLLGSTRPQFSGYYGGTTFTTGAPPAPIPIDTVTLKRTFVHTLGDSYIWVPETGWYDAVICGSFTSAATDGVTLLVNGVDISDPDYSAQAANCAYGGVPLTVHLTAGDYLQLALTGTWATAQPYQSTETYPRIDIWWRSRGEA